MRLPRLLRLAIPAAALAGTVATPAPASAAWDNVFQVTCHDCKRGRASYYAAPDPAPACTNCAPQQRSSYKIDYQQRSYYEPITVMKPEKYVEPVEVRSKSYYWDPVTSYSYSSYYDPCSQQCQQIATPRTSYRLKEQCNTSYRYVERIRMVPTQSQRMVTEQTPVVTYYGPTTRTYSAPADNCPVPPGGAAPQVDRIPSAPPSISPSTDGGGTIPSPGVPTVPNSIQRSYPPPAQARTTNAHTTSYGAGSVRGEVVLSDRATPRPKAKVVFVKADDYDRREYVTADEFGNFDTKLPAGQWFVYVGNGSGKAVKHSEKPITVGEYEAREFTLVSR